MTWAAKVRFWVSNLWVTGHFFCSFILTHKTSRHRLYSKRIHWDLFLETHEAYLTYPQLQVLDEKDSSCEIGYVLGKDYWGRGMMTEALKAVLDFCFTQAGFQKVRARYASLNPASGRVMEKAGMSYLKTIANGVERKDYVADLIYYQMSREDR